MYKQVQKSNSSFSPASIQKKSNNSYSSPAFSVQRQPEINSTPQPETPSYSRNAADLLAANVMQSLAQSEPKEGNQSQSAPLSLATVSQPVGEISIQRQCSKCQQEQSQEESQESDDLLSVAGIQTKLTVGAPGDRYEQEADAIAAQVMRMSLPVDNSPQVQRFGEEDNPVQRWSLAQSITPVVHRRVEAEQVQMRQLVQRAFSAGGEASGDLESRLNTSKGGGSALAPEVRAFMEPRFGADFSSVQVHTGGEAVQMNRELGAQAFAHGSDIYFGAGNSPGNNELTAHELTHVIQQTGSSINSSIQRECGVDESCMEEPNASYSEPNYTPVSEEPNASYPEPNYTPVSEEPNASYPEPDNTAASEEADNLSGFPDEELYDVSSPSDVTLFETATDPSTEEVADGVGMSLAAGPVMTPPGPNSPICIELLQQIMNFLYGGGGLHRGLIERYEDMMVDTARLYENHRTTSNPHPGGKGSWDGHVEQYKGQQRGLLRRINDWIKNGCDDPGGPPLPAEAEEYATRPAPSQPRYVTSSSSSSSAPVTSEQFDQGFMEKMAAITGLSGAALIAYLIISEGSRIIPPRNLIPIP